MTPESLAAAIEKLLTDDDDRKTLADGAKQAGRLQAAHDVARAAMAGFKRTGSMSLAEVTT